jgi:hypothetical protein
MSQRTVAASAANAAKSPQESFLWVVGAICNQAAALGNELITDHATIKAALDASNTWCTEVDGDLDDICDVLEFEHGLDGVIGGDYTITAGAAVTLTGAGRIRWRRDGQVYETALDTTITLGDDGDVDDTKWRAWRIEIADTGVVTATADGDTQHANEEDALLSLASKAKTASTVEIGYFTIHSDGGFNIGTDNVNGETAANVYYCKEPRQRAAGLTADMGAAIAIGSSDTNFSHGTIDCKTQGVKVAQIAAGADVAFDDADTIGENQFGGHLIVVGLDGASVYALASDGIAGAVSAMTHADLAAATTALDNVQDRIPAIFPVLGRITCENAKAGTFTYGTDDGAGTDGTFTFTSETYAAFDRTDQSGTGQGVDQPTIPASVTATIPAAGPATLTNSTAIDTVTTREQGTPS